MDYGYLCIILPIYKFQNNSIKVGKINIIERSTNFIFYICLFKSLNIYILIFWYEKNKTLNSTVTCIHLSQ